MNQTAVVLTPEHPRWDELLIPLMGRNGCNMRADVVKGWSWAVSYTHLTLPTSDLV